jgi:hypothetical protein
VPVVRNKRLQGFPSLLIPILEFNAVAGVVLDSKLGLLNRHSLCKAYQGKIYIYLNIVLSSVIMKGEREQSTMVRSICKYFRKVEYLMI